MAEKPLRIMKDEKDQDVRSPNVNLETLWDTRKQSFSMTVGDYTVTKEFSVGMGIKNTGGVSSRVMHKVMDNSLTPITNQEVEKALSVEVLEAELELMIRRRRELEERLPELEKRVEESIEQEKEDTDGKEE